MDFEVDYRKLLDHFREQGFIVRAYYYGAVMETQEFCPLRRLFDWLDYNGYAVTTKLLAEPAGRRLTRPSMAVDIAIDMLSMSQFLDRMVLISGDGDLKRAVDAVQRRGVNVTVASTIQPRPALIADALRRQADLFLDLAALRPMIELKGRAAGAGAVGAGRALSEVEDEWEAELDLLGPCATRDELEAVLARAPAGHPRAAELLAEINAAKHVDRPLIADVLARHAAGAAGRNGRREAAAAVPVA